MAEDDTWDQENDFEQIFNEEDKAYMDDSRSENEEDYGYEPGIEEPKPEPPDHVQHTSIYKKWYEEEEEEWREQEYKENDQREGAWAEDELEGEEEEHEPSTNEAEYGGEPWVRGGYPSSGSEEEPYQEEMESNCFKSCSRTPWCEIPYTEHEDYHPPKRAEKFNSYGVVPYKVQAYSKPTSPKKQVKKRSRSLVFSGISKDPEVYLQWEENMEEWLQINKIPKEKKLVHAVSAFRLMDGG